MKLKVESKLTGLDQIKFNKHPKDLKIDINDIVSIFDIDLPIENIIRIEARKWLAQYINGQWVILELLDLPNITGDEYWFDTKITYVEPSDELTHVLNNMIVSNF